MTLSNEDTVGALVTLVRGTTYQGDLVGKPGPALLGLGSIVPGGGFRAGDFKTYGGECPEKLMLFPGDLYVSLKGATKDGEMIGSVARVPPEVARGRLTQDTVKLVFREGASDLRDYLYWLLRTPQYRSYCAGRAMGSAVVALSREDFLSYPVPELNDLRRKIVETLEGIELKIELNRQINETLEAMARAIFRDWFVDFGPTRAKMEGRAPYLVPDLWSLFPNSFNETTGLPGAWQAGTLTDIARTTGTSVQPEELDADTPYIGLEHMPRGSLALDQWGDASKVSSGKTSFARGDVLFGKLRPYFHKVGVAPIDGICSTDIVVLNSQLERLSCFVAMLVSEPEFVAFADRTSDGTKMPRTSWSKMSTYPIAIPSVEIGNAFEAFVRPMLDRLIANVHESKSLATTRDYLLLKLMSGEVRVGATE